MPEESGPSLAPVALVPKIVETSHAAPVVVENTPRPASLEAGLFPNQKVTVGSPESQTDKPAPPNSETPPAAEKTSTVESPPPPPPTQEIPANKPRDYYEILGIDKNATPAEIKSAFRHLATKLHPDVSPGTEEEFKILNEAWLILSDPDKRNSYDHSENLGRVVGAAGAAAEAMSDQAKAAFVDAGCRDIITGEDGKSKSLAQMSPGEIEAYGPAIIAATAEEMYKAFAAQADSKVVLATVIPPGEAMAIRALLEAGSQKEAYLIALLMLILALISVLQVIGSRIAGDKLSEANAFENVTSYTQGFASMLGMLKGSPDIASAVNKMLNQKTRSPSSAPPIPQPAAVNTSKPEPQVNNIAQPELNRSAPVPELPAMVEPEPEKSPPLLSAVSNSTLNEQAAAARNTITQAAIVTAAVQPQSIPSPR
jgi:hypothetical protein